MGTNQAAAILLGIYLALATCLRFVFSFSMVMVNLSSIMLCPSPLHQFLTSDNINRMMKQLPSLLVYCYLHYLLDHIVLGINQQHQLVSSLH